MKCPRCNEETAVDTHCEKCGWSQRPKLIGFDEDALREEEKIAQERLLGESGGNQQGHRIQGNDKGPPSRAGEQEQLNHLRALHETSSRRKLVPSDLKRDEAFDDVNVGRSSMQGNGAAAEQSTRDLATPAKPAKDASLATMFGSFSKKIWRKWAGFSERRSPARNSAGSIKPANAANLATTLAPAVHKAGFEHAAETTHLQRSARGEPRVPGEYRQEVSIGNATQEREPLSGGSRFTRENRHLERDQRWQPPQADKQRGLSAEPDSDAAKTKNNVASPDGEDNRAMESANVERSPMISKEGAIESSTPDVASSNNNAANAGGLAAPQTPAMHRSTREDNAEQAVHYKPQTISQDEPTPKEEEGERRGVCANNESASEQRVEEFPEPSKTSDVCRSSAESTSGSVDTEKDRKTKAKKTTGNVDIDGSRVEQLNVVGGNGHAFVKSLKIYPLQGIAASQTWGDKRSLIDITRELPVLPDQDSGLAAWSANELNVHIDRLRNEHILLISCVDTSISRSAAYAVVRELGFVAKQQRLLNFERLDANEAALDVYGLTNKEANSGGAMVVVADAVADKAKPFLDSLFDASGAISHLDIRNSLKEKEWLLICLVNDERLKSRIVGLQAEFPFPRWTISFLQYVLRSFPEGNRDLEKAIAAQREAGKWSSDDAEFCRQVKQAIKADKLDSIVKRGGVPINPGAQQFDDGEPVHNVVRYVAAFFDELSPNEFDRVVSVLLGHQTTSIQVTVDQVAADGTIRPVEVRKDKELIQIWREGSDAILRKCQLVTAANQDGMRLLRFSDAGYKDALRQYLEEQYGMYVQSRLTAVLSAGLLFDASERIARSVVRLTAEMAPNYTDYYGEDWLFEAINETQMRLASTTRDVQSPEAGMVRLLGEATGLKTPGQAYQRISQLLRKMLDDTDLQPLVRNLGKRLIGAGRYEAAIEIVKNLRFAPGFDAYRWIRQVVDSGTEQARFKTYQYLYGELKRCEIPVYQVLHGVASWLEPEDHNPKKCSYATKYALRLTIEYCLEITSGFNPSGYGRPSQFPLFALEEGDGPKACFSVLVKLLLHPAMKDAIEDSFADQDDNHSTDGSFSDQEYNRLVAALLAEWAFILLGEQVPVGTAYDGPGAMMQKTLLAAIVAHLQNARCMDVQSQLLAYWEEMKDYLAFATNELEPIERQQRNEFIWKRKVVRALISEFRDVQRRLRAERNNSICN